jgi:hypothetical protein
MSLQAKSLSNRAQSPPWVSQMFCLSDHRGLLPFRWADLCIAEPYHPNRVARQFKLDQDLPYSPLVDVHTEEDFGVAYAYWAHLLQLVPQNMDFIPAENRIGGCTVYWLKWYSKFFQPFSILSKLSAATARGRICFEDRKVSSGQNYCYPPTFLLWLFCDPKSGCSAASPTYCFYYRKRRRIHILSWSKFVSTPSLHSIIVPR